MCPALSIFLFFPRASSSSSLSLSLSSYPSGLCSAVTSISSFTCLPSGTASSRAACPCAEVYTRLIRASTTPSNRLPPRVTRCASDVTRFFLFSSLLFFCLCVFTAFEIGPRSSSIPVCLFVFVRSLWSFSYREGIYCTPFCQEKKYVVSELPMFRPTGLLLRRLRGDTVTERRCLLKGQCRNYTTLCQRSVLSLKMNEEGTCLSIM